MLDFRIRSFLAVCAEKSFSRAAVQLHVTQPAVSQHIAQLENLYGTALFHFKGREFHLTEAGRLLLRYASTADADGRKTEELIRSGTDQIPFRFGATRTIGEYVMPDCIAAWLIKFPEAEVSMNVDNTEALLEALKAGHIDFAFIEGIFNREDFEVHPFMRDAFIALCGPKDVLARRKAALEEVLKHRLIVREKGSGSRKILEHALASRNRDIKNFMQVLEIGNVEAIKKLVGQGAGISFLYEVSVRQELALGSLVKIRLEGFPVQHDYSFVMLKKSLYARRYLDFLKLCLKAVKQ